MGSWDHPQLPPAYPCTLPVLLLGICGAPVSVILLPCGEDALLGQDTLLGEANGPTPLPAHPQLSPPGEGGGGGQVARGLVQG